MGGCMRSVSEPLLAPCKRLPVHLEDGKDLRHWSMHKFGGRSISPTGKGTRLYHDSSYLESKSKGGGGGFLEIGYPI